MTTTTTLQVRVLYSFQRQFTASTVWQVRNFAVDGVYLIILDAAMNVLHSFPVTTVKIEHLSGHVYELKKHGRAHLELSCPSASALEKFQSALHLAKTH
ncbi:Aste57867_3432 [Aphanomyces stellatus]|uniref:Aste57867_3432 protein n=1 Tax=Aphanomyces stellatus TaxID=120398 RepID=A0A485KDJ6_9STRA|nr:hypothetical protein As57867_003422 [Aphanomyces stellatus]VFT80598.1 Aste57867_3432 [Aphanomyces stellatus]